MLSGAGGGCRGCGPGSPNVPSGGMCVGEGMRGDGDSDL